MTDEDYLASLENVSRAVRAYARIEFETLARRVIYQLQRFPASGNYGDDFRFRSLWDEWCYEVQAGPHGLLDYAWHDLLTSLGDAVLEDVPGHIAQLLSVYATGEVDGEGSNGKGLSICPYEIQLVLRDQLREVAAHRKLERFLP